MRRLTIPLAAPLAALLLAPALALAAPPAARPKLAVLELKAGEGLSAKVAGTLTAIVVADAARAGFQVIAQADIVAMLSFQKQRQQLGCSDDGCLAELAGALGADYVVAGEVARIGSRDHVALSLLDARKARVVARSAGFSDAGDDALAMAAQARFRALVRQERPDLVAALPPIEPPGAAARHARRTAAWWTLGGSGALLVAGGVVGLSARSQAHDLRATAWQQPGYQAAYDRQRRTAHVADALLGAGVLGAGAAAVLWYGSTPQVVALPVATSDGLGVAVAGRF
jgi:TolB-like protein